MVVKANFLVAGNVDASIFDEVDMFLKTGAVTAFQHDALRVVVRVKTFAIFWKSNVSFAGGVEEVLFTVCCWPRLVFYTLLDKCEEWLHVYVGESALVALRETDVVHLVFVVVAVDPLCSLSDCISHVSVGVVKNVSGNVPESNVQRE